VREQFAVVLEIVPRIIPVGLKVGEEELEYVMEFGEEEIRSVGDDMYEK